MTGHTGRHLINPTAQYLGIQATGRLNPCEHCARCEIRQANIPYISEGTPARKQGERIFIDISSMMYASAGGKNCWLLIVEEGTDYAVKHFLEKEK